MFFVKIYIMLQAKLITGQNYLCESKLVVTEDVDQK